MSTENNNICNAVNCVSCVLKDFSDKQVGVITPNALDCCSGLPVSCCVLPANDLNDWYNFAIPPFSHGTDKMLFHRCDDCFYYPMCYCESQGMYMLDKTKCIQNGQVYCIGKNTSTGLHLVYGGTKYYLSNTNFEWWLRCATSEICTIYVYVPSINANNAFVVNDIYVYYAGQYCVQSNGLLPTAAFGYCYRHDSIGDKVCLL